MGTMWRKSKQQLNNQRERDFSNTHSARELMMGLQFSIANTQWRAAFFPSFCTSSGNSPAALCVTKQVQPVLIQGQKGKELDIYIVVLLSVESFSLAANESTIGSPEFR
jgi:hypothetical protein